MGHNPYTESHNKLKAIVEKLNNDMRVLKESLFWYQNTNLEKLSQELQLCPSEIKDRALNLTGIENKIASLTSNLSETESNIKTILTLSRHSIKKPLLPLSTHIGL